MVSASAAGAAAVPGVAAASTRAAAPGPMRALGPQWRGEGWPPPIGEGTLARLIGAHVRTLRRGTATEAGLVPAYVAKVAVDAASGLAPGTGSNGQALYPGVVALGAHRGVVVSESAGGFNLKYADQQGAELPRSKWIPTTTDTIYDLASLSKLFTSTVAVQQLEAGTIDLNATVASYLPDYAQHGKQDITILQCLTHTSGLPPDPSPALWTYPTYDERIAAILANPITSPPGTVYLYSDLNMLTLQLVLQKVTGKALDVLVREGITEPLGMKDTMYNPPASLKYRIAAEEYELVPDRGLVWGQVHDENAWALNGVAGHAGVFSTAHDLAVMAQAMLNGGSYRGRRILGKDWVVAMMTNYNQKFPGDDHGLGFELYQLWYDGALGTPYTAGHTGFTGTSIVIDPTTESFVILLTNRVHPNRNTGSTNPPRRAVGDDMARAVPVRAPGAKTAWYGQMNDATTATLSLQLRIPRSCWLGFAIWYDTEPDSDFLSLESSVDGGTSWKPVSMHVRGVDIAVDGSSLSGYDGHQWCAAWADLSGLAGAVTLRWRYATDPLYHGRGVYVADVLVGSGWKLLFDSGRASDDARFAAVGWVPSST